MTNREEQVLLEQIRTDPADDTARLVYADWLEEAGDADRAELIRVQIKRASLQKWDPRQLPLLVRESALMKEHEREWKEKLPKIDSVIWGAFRRGFVTTAKITDLALLKSSGDACMEATPLESLSIEWPDPRTVIDDAAPIEGLKELTLLDSTYVAPDEINMIAWSPILSTIETLNVGECNLGADGLRRLAESTHLKNLKAFRLPFNSIGNSGLDVLMGAESLTSLTELDLSERESYSRYHEDPTINESGLLSLVDWPGMNHIRSLNLSGNDVGNAGMYALLQSNHTHHLKELFLRNNGIRGEGMVEIVDATDHQLEVLDLGENHLGDIGTKYVASTVCLRNLKWLQLDRCEISQSSASALTDSPFFHSLRRLNVNDNNFGPVGLREILQSEPAELHTLQIANNDLLDSGAKHLAASPASARLQAIDLSKNRLGDEAAEALASSDHLGQLFVLRLSDNKIGKSAAAQLLGSSVGQQLVALDQTVQADEAIPF